MLQKFSLIFPDLYGVGSALLPRLLVLDLYFMRANSERDLEWCRPSEFAVDIDSSETWSRVDAEPTHEFFMHGRVTILGTHFPRFADLLPLVSLHMVLIRRRNRHSDLRRLKGRRYELRRRRSTLVPHQQEHANSHSQPQRGPDPKDKARLRHKH